MSKKFHLELTGTASVYAYTEVEADNLEDAISKGSHPDVLREVEWHYNGIQGVYDVIVLSEES